MSVVRTHALPWIAVAAFGAMAAFRHELGAEPKEKVVAVTSQRFRYAPDHIVLKKGEPVVLELTSRDVLMGFNLAAFHLRADVMPGTIARVRFTPDKTGLFDFFCDIFCGTDHESMIGTIEVVE
jgi:cytochrome c oxidase subunit 2